MSGTARQHAPTRERPDATAVTREFRADGEGHYVLTLRELGIQFDIDRLRREQHQLIGELSVRCDLVGARTFDGVLSVGDLNLSSVRARQDRGKVLAVRSRAPELDWPGLLEELCQRVLAAERTGQPAVLLRELPAPSRDEEFDVDGLRLLARHPAIWFGDGGGGKSLAALYVGGRLAQRGVRLLYADWEFAGEDHRDRLERLFGPDMPDVLYVRCDRPLVAEADRLRRIVREEHITYMIFDSIAFACDGPPEAAESAATYFRAVRQIGVGSLHIAHTTKAENGDAKPFGSVFWHNGARATWFVKRAAESPDGHQIAIGLFNRKLNVGALRPAVGFEITFGPERTSFRRVDLADVEDLADRLPLWQRMAALLRRGAQTPEAIAEELGAKLETITRTARKNSKLFVKMPGAGDVYRIGLAARPESLS